MSDIHVLSHGAGVQTSCLLLMACYGEITPKPDLVVFADTGREPKKVYDYLEWMKSEVSKYGIEIVIVSKGDIMDDIRHSIKVGGRADSLPYFTKGKNGSHGMVHRQCTLGYKISQVRLEVRKFQSVTDRKKDHVRMWMGISTDEVERMRTSDLKWTSNRYPLIEKMMNRLDCLAWLKRHGYPEPPKSSCTFCPFHSDHMWLDMKRNDPNSWDEAVEMDRLIRNHPAFDDELYLHDSRTPLETVDLNENQLELDLFRNECHGYCGV
jgi:hypothetical protein